MHLKITSVELQPKGRRKIDISAAHLARFLFLFKSIKDITISLSRTDLIHSFNPQKSIRRLVKFNNRFAWCQKRNLKHNRTIRLKNHFLKVLKMLKIPFQLSFLFGFHKLFVYLLHLSYNNLRDLSLRWNIFERWFSRKEIMAFKSFLFCYLRQISGGKHFLSLFRHFSPIKIFPRISSCRRFRFFFSHLEIMAAS